MREMLVTNSNHIPLFASQVSVASATTRVSPQHLEVYNPVEYGAQGLKVMLHGISVDDLTVV